LRNRPWVCVEFAACNGNTIRNVTPQERALKKKEHARRDARMVGLIKAHKLPYIPSVMSWLSTRRTNERGASRSRRGRLLKT